MVVDIRDASSVEQRKDTAIADNKKTNSNAIKNQILLTDGKVTAFFY